MPRALLWRTPIPAEGGLRAQPRGVAKAPAQGRGISFDALDGRDCAELMSQLNSEPRPSLMGLSPIAMPRAAMPHEAEALTDALGMREVPYGRLDLTPRALSAARAERGLPPLL